MGLLPALLLVLLALSLPGVAGAQGEPPGAATGEARSVTRDTASVTGRVDPNRSETTYRFEYGTSADYGLETAARSAGNAADPADVEAALDGLTPSTTYHYRVVATNAAGVTRGADRTFRTAPATPDPSPPAASTSGSRSVATSSAILVARVDPNRAATRVRFEYGTSTAYGATSPERDHGSGDSPREVAIPIAGLRARTTYRFRVVATNSTGTTRGADRTFRTLAAPRSVTVTLATDRVALGGAAELRGRVSGAGVGNLGVALEAQPFPFGAAPFTRVGTATTNASGTYRLTTPPLLASTRLRVVTRSSVVSVSPTATALVRLRVGARPGREASRRRATVSGTVTPATAGTRISVQRRTSTGRYVRVGRTTTRALDGGRSRYSVRIRRARATSTYRVSALPPSGGPHVRGTSRELRIRGRG